MALRATVLPLFLTAVRGLMSRDIAKTTLNWQPNPDLYNTKPWKVEVDLDLPPEERWNHVVRVHRVQLIHRSRDCSKNIELFGRDRLDRWLNGQHIPEEFKREMRGLVKAANHSNVTYDCTFLYNHFYETDIAGVIAEPQSMCSGVLAAMSNGTVIHARNADFSHDYGQNAAAALDVTFTRSGKPIYAAIMKVGMIGMHSGMLFGGWSFEQNTRFDGLSSDTNIVWAEKGGQSFGFMARKFMEDGLSYAEAVERFSTTKWTAPQYFIVAGAGAYEGAVITIDPSLSFQNVEVINSYNRYMIYQLNKDSWLKNDENRDLPPQEFQDLLSHDSVDVNEDTVWSLITTAPLYNDLTFMTFEAIPATGYWKVFLKPEGTLIQAYKREQADLQATLLERQVVRARSQAAITGDGDITLEG